MGCTYSIFLQIDRILDAAEFVHPTREAEIVDGDLEDIRACDAVLAAFAAPDEGTAMEAWYAHSLGKPVIAYTSGTAAHPWSVYVSVDVHADLEEAIRALAQALGRKPQRR